MKLDVSEQNDSLKTSLFPFLVIVLFFYAGQFRINQLRRLVPSRGSCILSETWMSCLPDSARTEILSLPNWGIHSCSRGPSSTFQPSGLKTLRRSKWKWTGRGGNVICPTVHHCHQKEQKRLNTGKLLIWFYPVSFCRHTQVTIIRWIE